MLLESKCTLFTVSICLLHFSTEQEELFPVSEYFVSFVSTIRGEKTRGFSFSPIKHSHSSKSKFIINEAHNVLLMNTSFDSRECRRECAVGHASCST